MCKPAGYCFTHAPNHEELLVYNREEKKRAREREREMVERWKRDQQLRTKILPTVADEQDNLCKGFWVSDAVKRGRAVNRCQWGWTPVPLACQALDHIVRVADGGGDERENLQMLCACCHARKTAADARSLTIGRKVEE